MKCFWGAQFELSEVLGLGCDCELLMGLGCSLGSVLCVVKPTYWTWEPSSCSNFL